MIHRLMGDIVILEIALTNTHLITLFWTQREGLRASKLLNGPQHADRLCV